MDCSEMNSQPGSVCFTCALADDGRAQPCRQPSARQRRAGERKRAFAISKTCFRDIVLRTWCPGFWLPDDMPASGGEQ